MNTTCPYCKDPVFEIKAVACPTCDAVHHTECWQANGESCSVYGCESRIKDEIRGCPWCEEVYKGESNCRICSSPLMTPQECRDFLNRYEWVKFPLVDDRTASLAAGYLRNNGILARVKKGTPISMFRIAPRAMLFVAREDEIKAQELMEELSNGYTNCFRCGHVLFKGETGCSYCSELERSLNDA